MLTQIATERGYKAGWIAHKFKEKFGTWPPPRSAPPIEPSPEVLAWVRSRNIAYAKAKGAGSVSNRDKIYGKGRIEGRWTGIRHELLDSACMETH